MDDLISRQEAIDALSILDISDGVGISCIASGVQYSAIRAIEDLPSAEPEIIRCKDCKYYTTEIGDSGFALGFCPFINSHLVMSKGFCAWAERRNDG